MLVFERPDNYHRVKVKAPRLWTLLFGPLYFAAHGVWSHALIAAVIAIPTIGISWFAYPFFAPNILRRSYLTRGWRETI